MDSDNVYVATEDNDILNFCKKNIKCKDKKAATAIDRVKLFSDIIKSDLYINVQGDEPVFNIKDLKKLIEMQKNSQKELFLKNKLHKKRVL